MQNVSKEKILKKIEEGYEIASFAKGWFQAYHILPEPRMKQLEVELKEALGTMNPATFWRRLTGKCYPTVLEAKKIEEVFAKYGITEVFYQNREEIEHDLEE